MEVRRESLEEQANHTLEECRIIVPGIQAMIGFQLIAFFNEGFKRLAWSDQLAHFAATLVMVTAMFFLLAPSAYQRIAESGQISKFFIHLTTRFIFLAMLLLRLGISAEIFVIARSLSLSYVVSIAIAISIFILGWVLWSGFPLYLKYSRR